jgi:hypothetical protein
MAGAALFLTASVVAAVDPPNFDFNGYAVVPTAVGGTLTMRSVLTNNGVVPTPIPLDFTNFQYTLVVTGTLAGSSGIAQQYNPATIALYSDPLGGTPANYGVPGTFTDGTLILAGVFDGNLIRNTFTPTLGNFVGKVNFNAGTRLGDLPTPNGWPFGGGWSRTISGIPAGYQENWDGKIDNVPVAVERQNWDGVKGMYR